MPRTTLSRMLGSACRGWGADLRVQFWDVQPRISAVTVTPVWICPLEGGLSCKLGFRGCFFFFFFSVAACGLGRVVGTKISRARSEAVSLTGFGLNCWHRSEAMGDEAAVLDGA